MSSSSSPSLNSSFSESEESIFSNSEHIDSANVREPSDDYPSYPTLNSFPSPKSPPSPSVVNEMMNERDDIEFLTLLDIDPQQSKINTCTSEKKSKTIRKKVIV